MQANGKKLTAAQVRARYGDISEMTLWRWSNDTALDFPKPYSIRCRRYWSAAELDAWEAARKQQGQAA